MMHSHSEQIRETARLFAAAVFLCCQLFACASVEEDTLQTIIEG